MKKTINQPGPAQAGNEESRDLFQRTVRDMVREGLLQMITDEVSMLCGTSYRPQEGGLYRRAGTELVRIRTSEGTEFIDKRRVRKMGPDGNGTKLSPKAQRGRNTTAHGNALGTSYLQQ